MTSHKHGLAAKSVSNWWPRAEVASFETNLVRIKAGTSEALTSLSGKAECLLAVGEDKKSKLFGVTCLVVNSSVDW